MADKVKKRFVDVIVVDPFTVQFCALSVILLAFFILLNSMATIDSEKTRLAIGSLIGTFGQVPGGRQSSTETGLLDFQNITFSAEELDEMTERLADLLGNDQLEGGIDVQLRGDDIVIVLSCSVLFEEGSDTLLPGARQLIGEVAKQMLSVSDRRVTIEGYTDERSTIYSEFGSAWWFAAARAAQVHSVLIDVGIDPGRLRVASLGSGRPAFSERTEHQRDLNRRIEIVILEGALDPRHRPATQSVDVGGFEFEVPNSGDDGPGESE